MDISSKCPITDIYIGNDDDELPESYDEQFSFGKGALYISRNSDNLPVVQFKLTENYPCIEEDEYDVTWGKYFYKLFNKPQKLG